MNDSMERIATHLADSLCARLCHEMASPLGTLMNALEMAVEDPQTASESLPLASEVATQMARRLRLLRAAWAGDCGPLAVAELADLARGLPPRVRTEFTDLSGAFAAPVARVLVNMLLLAVEGLPRGGTITLSGAAGDDMVLMLAGVQAQWPAGLALVLADPASAVLDDPRVVQAPLVAHLAREAGLRLSLLMSPSGHQAAAAPLLLSPA